MKPFHLDAMIKIAQKYHYFFNEIKIIHVAGTNGKGSTTHMLANILEEGYRVGLYQSPYHQNRFDNIKINHQPISEESIKKLMLFYQEDFIEFGLSEFEIDTWIALAYFYIEKVDIMIIEVGLGGIDDATNIITPIISVITNVGTDHQDVLGKGIKQIATKKSGIIKKSVPVIVGPNLDMVALEVIQEQALLKQSKIIITKIPEITQIKPNLIFKYETQNYQVASIASYQSKNAAIVLEIIKSLNDQGIKIDQESVKKGFMKPLINKRFELIHQSPNIIFDAAHNLEGMIALKESIMNLDIKNLLFIVSILKDKPYHDMLDVIATMTHHIYFTTFSHDRALDLKDFHHPGVNIIRTESEILELIKNNKNKTIIITGSLYFLRNIYPLIKGATYGKE